MINENYQQFEISLIREYKKNANPELAEALIKEFSSHFIKKTIPTNELNNWIKDKSKKAYHNPINTDSLFGLRGVGQRSEKELLYLSMNAFCWNLFLQGLSSTSTYQQVADIFKTSPDTIKFGFERKNHDFGQRELCRFGLDLYIAIYQKTITLNDKNIISSILNESIDIQMRKDLKHHRAKYINKLQLEDDKK